MAVTTVDRTEHTSFWQIVLCITGAVILVAGAVLEIVLLSYHSTSKVSKTGGTTTTITGPAAPPASLITACMTVGILLILAAAFFSRISKVVLPGGYELDLENSAKIAAAIATKTSDPAKAEQLYKQVAPRVAEMATVPAKTARVSSAAQPEWSIQQLDPGTIDGLVTEAEREVSQVAHASG
jgi:hypothetical protein